MYSHSVRTLAILWETSYTMCMSRSSGVRENILAKVCRADRCKFYDMIDQLIPIKNQMIPLWHIYHDQLIPIKKQMIPLWHIYHNILWYL